MADLGPPPNVAPMVQADAGPTERPAQIGAAEANMAPPMPPYGPPINAATQRGDLAEMEATLQAARLALAQGNSKYAIPAMGSVNTPQSVVFAPVTGDNEATVLVAMARLETAIANLKAAQGSE